MKLRIIEPEKKFHHSYKKACNGIWFNRIIPDDKVHRSDYVEIRFCLIGNSTHARFSMSFCMSFCMYVRSRSQSKVFSKNEGKEIEGYFKNTDRFILLKKYPGVK